MNCAALDAPSANIGPLFPIIPTLYPCIAAVPVTVCLPNSGLKSKYSDPSTIRAITSLTSYAFL